MTQTLVLAVLAITLALFMWDRYRYEAVALAALLVLVAGGAIAPADAFLGFAHPAVVTVAAVLVISRALANAGVVDLIAQPLTRAGGGPALQVAMLTAVVALLSGFMNNIGALALLMPVAIRMAQERGYPPSLVLMPMAFASLLGGLLTVIGTPPNLIVATFRAREAGTAFAMFDFLPVGAAIAVGGVAFLALAGWRLLPRRRGKDQGSIAFELDEYLAEVRVPADSKLIGESLDALAKKIGDSVALVGLLRGDRRVPAYYRYERLQAGDELIVEAEAEDLKQAVDKLGLELAGRGAEAGRLLRGEDTHLAEVVVLPDSRLVGHSAADFDLRLRFGVNLLAVSRQGGRAGARPSRLRLQAGDVLLLEGEREALPETLSALGCLPLASRDLAIGRPRRMLLALALFAGAIAAAALGWVPIQLSFVACALACGAFGMLSAREAYRAVDWPVIVLLGAMLPIGAAMETSGTAALIAEGIAQAVTGWPPYAALVLVLVATMFLSDIVNNAAAAVLMCPIAAGLAQHVGASVDPFLMAVAIGASCAFLTPVGHQSNTLVMGPGGYRFRDYWPLGLPLQALVAVVAAVMIPRVWPL